MNNNNLHEKRMKATVEKREKKFSRKTSIEVFHRR